MHLYVYIFKYLSSCLDFPSFLHFSIIYYIHHSQINAFASQSWLSHVNISHKKDDFQARLITTNVSLNDSLQIDQFWAISVMNWDLCAALRDSLQCKGFIASCFLKMASPNICKHQSGNFRRLRGVWRNCKKLLCLWPWKVVCFMLVVIPAFSSWVIQQ